jgi:hypothetical protein
MSGQKSLLLSWEAQLAALPSVAVAIRKKKPPDLFLSLKKNYLGLQAYFL